MFAVLAETAVGVLRGIALRVELSCVLDYSDHRALRHPLALLSGVDRRLVGVIFADLLILRAVEGHVGHAFP
jgi:hypothetical protein